MLPAGIPQETLFPAQSSPVPPSWEGGGTRAAYGRIWAGTQQLPRGTFQLARSTGHRGLSLAEHRDCPGAGAGKNIPLLLAALQPPVGKQPLALFFHEELKERGKSQISAVAQVFL